MLIYLSQPRILQKNALTAISKIVLIHFELNCALISNDRCDL
jgi:hypothetical protein